jgi:multidrug transporter EmrE-like cation transporter
LTIAGFIFILLAAFVTAISNLLLRFGVLRGGGFGVSGNGLLLDILRLLREPAFVCGTLLYGVAALIWFRVISTENLVGSYVTLVGITIVSVSVGGYLVFHEPMPSPKIVGMSMIIGGVFLVSRS